MFTLNKQWLTNMELLNFEFKLCILHISQLDTQAYKPIMTETAYVKISDLCLPIEGLLLLYV